MPAQRVHPRRMTPSAGTQTLAHRFHSAILKVEISSAIRQQSINHLAVGSGRCRRGSEASLDRILSFDEDSPVSGCNDHLVTLFQVRFGAYGGRKHNPPFCTNSDRVGHGPNGTTKW